MDKLVIDGTGEGYAIAFSTVYGDGSGRGWFYTNEDGSSYGHEDQDGDGYGIRGDGYGCGDISTLGGNGSGGKVYINFDPSDF